MNHKGQSLVLFVLLLPIILIALAFVVDIGLLSITKKNVNQKLEQIIEDILQNNLNEEMCNQLINDNFDNIESKSFSKKDDSVEITIQIKLESIFPHIMLQNRYKVTYVGYINSEQINIVRK